MLPSPITWSRGSIVATWLTAVAGGLGLLLIDKSTPGAVADPPAFWPADARPRGDGLHLILFLHPHCPCSRATVAELARAIARCGDRLTTDVVFYRPASRPEGWGRGELWDLAAAVPGVRTGWDEDGAEARRFGVRTSGHALLYDRDGGLLFSGGLTGARGHEGDNPGRDAVVALVSGRAAPPTCPVFGCALMSAAEGRP